MKVTEVRSKEIILEVNHISEGNLQSLQTAKYPLLTLLIFS